MNNEVIAMWTPERGWLRARTEEKKEPMNETKDDDVDEATMVHAGRLRIAMEDVYFAAREAAQALGTAPATEIATAAQKRVSDRYLDAVEHLRAFEEAIAERLGRK